MNDEPRASTMAGAAADTVNKLISTLPAQFLVLVLMNIAFLGMVMWFISHNIDRRSAMIEKVVEACLLHKGDTQLESH